VFNLYRIGVVTAISGEVAGRYQPDVSQAISIQFLALYHHSVKSLVMATSGEVPVFYTFTT